MIGLSMWLCAGTAVAQESEEAATVAPAPEPEEVPAEAVAPPSDPPTKERKNPVSVSFSEDFEFRIQNFDPAPLVRVAGPPPKFIEQVNRLTGRVSAGSFFANVQVDQVAFAGLPYLLDGNRVADPPRLILNCGLPECVQSPFGEYVYANPEKVAAGYDGDKVSFTVGDFYSAFGYGGSLNVNRNVDIDIDTSIQGARVVASPGNWEITGLAGTLNRQQVFADNPNVGLLEGDLRHLIAGARVERFGLGPADLGVHAVGYDFADTYGFQGALDEVGTSMDAVVAGGTVALYGVAGIDWVFEGDLYGFPLNEAGESELFIGGVPEPGHALFGSASFFVGSTIWQVDAKKYRNVNRINRPTAGEQYQSVIPPTLEYERAINFNTAASVLSNDVFGGRIRMDLALGAATPYIAVSAFRDTDLENASQHAPAPENIGQILGGAEVLLDDFTVLANALARAEWRDGDQGRDMQLYTDIDLKFPLVGHAHADLILIGQRFLAGPERENFVDAEGLDNRDGDWTELNASLSVLPLPDFGITGFLDYTTNPFAQNGGNLGGPNNYGAIEVFWKPASAWTVKAFHGGYAAGIRCSGGQCRNVPAFTGTRLAITGTF
ncbi:MAG: hypothetical protein KTR31_38460 [Myxococcales bacterium]|nr:hypothetical protein [Myxococcales bacterium]